MINLVDRNSPTYVFPAVGDVHFNTDTSNMEIWDGNNWVIFSVDLGYHDVDRFYEETEDEKLDRRVLELMVEFDEQPELLSKLTLELRKRKLEKLKR